MPTARDSLLNAASAALDARPWGAVRMVEVAAAAGVSRQTLYNEFGGKEGLARALVRRAADDFLAGADRALATARGGRSDPGECFAAATAWTLATARRNALVRAAITGRIGERLPPAAAPPARTWTDALARSLRDRAAGAIQGCCPHLDPADIGWACEAAVRLTFSYVLVPAGSDEDACLQVARLVRGLVADAAR